MNCTFWTKCKEVTLRRDLYLRVLGPWHSHSAMESAKLLRPANSPIFDNEYQSQRLVWDVQLNKEKRAKYYALLNDWSSINTVSKGK